MRAILSKFFLSMHVFANAAKRSYKRRIAKTEKLLLSKRT